MGGTDRTYGRTATRLLPGKPQQGAGPRGTGFQRAPLPALSRGPLGWLGKREGSWGNRGAIQMGTMTAFPPSHCARRRFSCSCTGATVLCEHPVVVAPAKGAAFGGGGGAQRGRRSTTSGNGSLFGLLA